MLKINAIKIEVNTSSGLFGADYEFGTGLNIVRGNNTSGKSSLFQSILYCLGFEELIGGRNEKTMQSVLKDIVEFPKGEFHNVLQSYVFLEIENHQHKKITLKRGVITQNRASQLIDVYEEGFLTEQVQNKEPKPMYIHDKGGASDEYYGFHLYLEDFLGWKLPNIVNRIGDSRKLYLQQVASGYIVEQKTGWSDFYATMPHYGLSNKEARVTEFLLSLDIYENQKKKLELNSEKRLIEGRWTALYTQFTKLSQKGNGRLVGLEPRPQIINDFSTINILLANDENEISISDYIDIQQEELEHLNSRAIPNVSDKIVENESKLEELNNFINRLSLNYEMLSSQLSFDKNKLGRYEEQLDSLNEDLRKNKGALKVKNLGAEIDLKSANDNCPTCNQPIKDSLLPKDIEQNPMNLDENISFVQAQIKMLNVYIEGIKHKISEKESKISFVRNKLNDSRQEVRQLKKELIADDRLPSELEIERKLNLKKRIEFYTGFLEDFYELLEDMQSLSKSYEKILSNEKELPNDYFSINDRKKIDLLRNEFIRILNKVDYKSKPSNFIKISMENYLPIVNEPIDDEEMKSYNIRFDSSGSDFIRCIWSYYCSLLKVSQKYGGHHPGLLMFDEPKQQDIAIEHFHEFLSELSTYNNSQVIVFASFENSDESFNTATKGLNFKLNHITEKLVTPLNNRINLSN